MKAPIRPNLVTEVHNDLAKNHRQPYAVKDIAGEQTSAESWGTGRAVARIPRVRSVQLYYFDYKKIYENNLVFLMNKKR